MLQLLLIHYCLQYYDETMVDKLTTTFINNAGGPVKVSWGGSQRQHVANNESFAAIYDYDARYIKTKDN